MFEFTKMQATGNDFVLIDARKIDSDWSALAKLMCDRHFGIGSDGILLVKESETGNIKMQMFNPDGSEAETCGNGLRCFGKFIFENNIYTGKQLKVKTLAGEKIIKPIYSGKSISGLKVAMGKPVLNSVDIPVSLTGTVEGTPLSNHFLVLENIPMLLNFVSIGNPHAVYFTEQPVNEFPLSRVGPSVENNKLFPKRTNFEIVNVIDRKKVKARVWERGAGETLACGSGACAIGVAALLLNYVDSPVEINLPGGYLTIEWNGKDTVYLSGPAEIVFTGHWSENRRGN
ncbi:MAG: diaminopimelate epimerase [Chloroflexi bacterium]|nr:diaminopimelate epimerase [Chloroflexota bacterium]